MNEQLKSRHKTIITTVKKKIIALVRKIVEKGQQNLTIIFVPHSEKKIHNFQISNFALTIIILIIISTSIIGSASYYTSNKLSKKIDKSNIDNLRLISEKRKFIKYTTEVTEIVSGLTKELTTLQKITRGNNTKGGKGGPISKYDYNINPYGNIEEATKEISELSNLRKKLSVVKKDLQFLSTNLEKHKQILDYMPSAYPVWGGGSRVSGFGNRRDPFTYKMAFHKGVDIINVPGTPIVAAAGGTVINAKYTKGNGLYVELKHKYGFSTLYMHLSSIKVKARQQIRKGQIIGRLGNTGRSTGPHLHYEVRINSRAINPSPFMSLSSFSNFINSDK